jgi:hypothetical protein
VGARVKKRLMLRVRTAVKDLRRRGRLQQRVLVVTYVAFAMMLIMGKVSAGKRISRQAWSVPVGIMCKFNARVAVDV